MAESAASRGVEFHCGPLSDPGEGIDLDGGGITVVAVLVLAEEASESNEEKEPGVGS